MPPGKITGVRIEPGQQLLLKFLDHCRADDHVSNVSEGETEQQVPPLRFASVGMTKGRAVLSVEFGKWLKGTRSERNLLGLRLFGVDCEDPALGYLLPDADC